MGDILVKFAKIEIIDPPTIELNQSSLKNQYQQNKYLIKNRIFKWSYSFDNELVDKIFAFNTNVQLNSNQLLFCEETTNIQELSLFLNRFMYTKGESSYFIINPNKLFYKTLSIFRDKLHELIENKDNLTSNLLFVIYNSKKLDLSSFFHDVQDSFTINL